MTEEQVARAVTAENSAADAATGKTATGAAVTGAAVTGAAVTGAAVTGAAVTGASASGAVVVARPRKVLYAAWIGAVAVVVLFVVVAVVLRTTETGVYFRLADQVSLVLMGLFIAGGMLLLTRPRVRADAEGIEVRNILVTRRYSWDVIERVAFPDGASWARLDLPDDEYMPVLAIQAVDGAYAVDRIRKIRALFAAAKGV